MGADKALGLKSLSRAFGIPPKRPRYFVVNSQLCAAVLMVALGGFCLWASATLSDNDMLAVADTFRRIGIPGEPRAEIWILAGELFTAWAFVCAWLAILAGRVVKDRDVRRMRWLIAGQTVSALFAGASAVAMNNFVRWPLAVVAGLWLWTVWGYWGIVRSWSVEEATPFPPASRGKG